MSRANSEGYEPASYAPPKTLNNTHPDFASDDARGKALSTMAAHAALAGCTLHELASGGFLLCRWGLAKELPDLRAVAAFARQVGGAV